MTTNENKTEIKFSEDQEKALKLLDIWFPSPDPIFDLFGYGGTGKTFLSKEYFKRIVNSVDKVYICSTTHPSLDALKAYFYADKSINLEKIRFMTLHKLLGFKPYVDPFTGERKFRSASGSKYLKQMEKRIVFIDECSMIGESMYHLLKNSISIYRFKTILMGDPAQLPPVETNKKNKGISPIFNVAEDYPHQYCLKQIMRTGNILLKKICKIFRNVDLEVPITSIVKKYVCDEFRIYRKDNLRTDKWFELFKELVTNSKNANEIPIILTWTNNQADEYNRLIRKNLFNVKINRYCPGDLVVFKTFYQSPLSNMKYYTATVIQIKSVETYEVKEINWKKADVKSSHMTFLKKLNKLSPEFAVNLITFDRIYAEHSSNVNNLDNKILAISLKSRTEYDKGCETIFKNLASYVEFCSKKDMEKLWEFYYENYVTPYADIIFAYSCTTHKAQSLTKPQVFVDLSDMILNQDKDELVKCMYTAVSRVSKGLYLLI